MFDPSKYTVPAAKPMPVMLLLDVSGSMAGIKIETLNDAIRIMLETFADDEKAETEIRVSVITFGEELKRLLPFTPASKITLPPLTARGGTPLGMCLKMAKAIIEDRDETPSRSYRPLVVLVSDGRPGDSWEQPMKDFITDGRSQKCDRMAMAIGADADLNVLGKFVEGTGNPLFEAHHASEIHNFFKKVTMTASVHTTGNAPKPASGPAEPPFSEPEPKPASGSPKPTQEPALDGATIDGARQTAVNDEDYF